jgi:hypothetical protein
VSARALIEQSQRCGVQLHVRNGQLVASPAARLPAPLRLQLSEHRREIARELAVAASQTVASHSAPAFLTPDEEAKVFRIADYIERRYNEAAEIRRQCSSGLPGARERDERVRTARSRVAESKCPTPTFGEATRVGD